MPVAGTRLFTGLHSEARGGGVPCMHWQFCCNNAQSNGLEWERGGIVLGPRPEGGGEVCQGHLVSAGGLVTVTRPHHEDVGHGTQGGQVLDGLVGGSVLSQTNGVMGHDKDDTGLQLSALSRVKT